MANLKEVIKFLDGELGIKDVEDSSNNGLQVQGKEEVNKIAFAVDACLEVFKKAKDSDMIIVHHGISWNDSLKYLTGLNHSRVKFLMENDISLYAAHLPLDKHPKHGNNAEFCRIFNLKHIQGFGDYHGQIIGFAGEKDTSLNDFVKEINEKLKTKCTVFDFGKKQIKKIAVVSGNGGGEITRQAISNGFDCLITGEAGHSSYVTARDSNINIIVAGHYATETLGVKALMKTIKDKFKVDVKFIDAPTGL
ncbi:MAG: Nif3-like dinuclear metal center hexameric protein [Candidatus Nanoarchaeia archaeon]|nr:Nif3-like dinuclear metal center hexameric protein [Candidatus Nanoarchaeia archaeon]